MIAAYPRDAVTLVPLIDSQGWFGYRLAMPLFEYVCDECGRKFTWLVGMVADTAPPTCDRCGAKKSTRKEVSRFARIRTEDQALDDLADPSSIGDLDDPSTMKRWAKEMGSELGEGLGNDFEEYADSSADDGN